MGNMEDDKLKKLDSEVDDLLAEMRGILGGEEEPAARPEPKPEPKPEPEPSRSPSPSVRPRRRRTVTR
jgi:hypothetical protein